MQGFKAPTPTEPRTTSSGASTRTRRPRARSRCSTARTTRTCWSSASTSWCRRRSGNALRPDQRLGAAARRGERHHHPQVLPADLARRSSSSASPQRLDDPTRQWKISDADYKERAFFDDYLAAFDEALERTSTPHAPWFTIPCDDKWFRDLAVARIVLDAMEGMKLNYPKPTVDLAQIRREYHAAVESERKAGGKA